MTTRAINRFDLPIGGSVLCRKDPKDAPPVLVDKVYGGKMQVRVIHADGEFEDIVDGVLERDWVEVVGPDAPRLRQQHWPNALHPPPRR